MTEEAPTLSFSLRGFSALLLFNKAVERVHLGRKGRKRYPDKGVYGVFGKPAPFSMY